MSPLLVLVKTGMVFGLLAAVLYVLKRTNGLGGRARAGLLEVRGTTRVGKGAALTVVRLDGQDLLLGVTDHTVTLLTAHSAPEPEAPAVRRTAVSRGSGAAVLAALRGGGTTTLAPEAVAAALAALRGEAPATDGPVAPPRTDARPAEEQPCADPAVA